MTSWYDNGPDVPKDHRGGFVTTADVLHNVVHMGMLFEASAETDMVLIADFWEA